MTLATIDGGDRGLIVASSYASACTSPLELYNARRVQGELRDALGR